MIIINASFTHGPADMLLSRLMHFLIWSALALSLSIVHHANSAETLNIYSSRHYKTDRMLYEGFTEKTGIQVNIIEGKSALLLQRLAQEGSHSPADVLLLSDASRLYEAQAMDLLARLRSPFIKSRIPSQLRTPFWFGFSTRARIIVVNRHHIAKNAVTSYQDLASPSLKNSVCSRSGSHPYNLSLLSSIRYHHGHDAATQWARGLYNNLARKPQGGDTDQIRAVAAGECKAAVANSYYVLRLMASDKPEDQEVIRNITVIFPNQDSTGTHLNISGAAMLKHAPHPHNAQRFLNYLASTEAQRHFSDKNHEWPAVQAVKPNSVTLRRWYIDTTWEDIPILSIANGRPASQKIFDRIGFQ